MEIQVPCPVTSDQRDTKAKLMECLKYIQQEKERLQKDVDQLDEILSKQFSIDIAVSLLYRCLILFPTVQSYCCSPQCCFMHIIRVLH